MELHFVLQNLKESFDGKPWYGISVMEKLDAIDWQRVNEQCYGKKSIAVLVKHIVNWRVFVLKKLQGDAHYDIIIDGPNDWTDVHIDSLGQWNALKEELRQTQSDLLAILSEHTNDLLTKQVPGKKYDFGPILISIAQHDIYHLGQIAMLNAMPKPILD